MTEPLRAQAGWEDLWALPEDTKAEVISGELRVYRERPGPLHAFSKTAVLGTVFGAFDAGRPGPGGWWVLPEPDVRLDPLNIVSPDAVGWRKDRVLSFPAEQPIDFVPDWVCEVLSPKTARRDRIVKADLYLRFGVPHYWLVDIDLRSLEALEAQAGRWVRLGAWTDGDRARVAPFEAIEIEVGSLFPPL